MAPQIHRQSVTFFTFAIMSFGAGCLVGAWGVSSSYDRRLVPAVRREVAIALFERLGGDFYLLDKSIEERFWSKAKIGSVDLSNTLVQDADLKLIEGTDGIMLMDLRQTAVSDAGLVALTTLPDLEVVDVRHTAVSQDGVGRFKKARPDCDIDWDKET